MNSRPQTAARIATPSLARLSAAQMLDGYRSSKFTPRDVIDEVIAALEATHSLCNVMATEMFGSARSEADRATAAWKAGEARALTGLPITIKDLVYVAGTPAKGGAPMLEGFVPDVDAAVVTAVKEAGAIITCKTTTCESGYKLTADQSGNGHHPQPLAPRPHQRWLERRRRRGDSRGVRAACHRH
jgi:aspartyl-tRNA(Asn)/glutamyl-tRNA(Gln) amidotransferase subunit A